MTDPQTDMALTNNWPQAGLARAKKLFPNQGMHVNAKAVASVHVRAMDYLEQAPVIACAGALGKSQSATALAFHNRLYGPVSRGASLAEVMEACALPYVLRKLKASAITPKYIGVIGWLTTFDPREIGNCIPEKASARAVWLKALQNVWEGGRRRQQQRPLGALTAERWRGFFVWTMRHAVELEKGTIGDLRDYAFHPDNAFNPDWSVKRIMRESEAWHRRLRDRGQLERQLARTGIPLTMEIDIGKHGVAVIDGVRCEPLRTPRALYEEGAAMRHCVGSYVQSVLKGLSHIISLRDDATGQRLATLELSKSWGIVQLKAFANGAPSLRVKRVAEIYRRTVLDAATAS